MKIYQSSIQPNEPPIHPAPISPFRVGALVVVMATACLLLWLLIAVGALTVWQLVTGGY